MKHFATYLIKLMMLTAPWFIIPQQPTLAATLTAGNEVDLIDAINTANGTVDADNILLTGNITLTGIVDTGLGNTGLPVINSEIIIHGQGHTITRDTNAPDFRILRVVYPGELTLSNLTVSNGKIDSTSGGGIHNTGALTILNSTITGNVQTTNVGGGGAVYNGRDLIVNSSVIASNSAQHNGGGILNAGGAFTIINSRISDNTANKGAGIDVDEGGGTITSSSVLNNNTTQNGGAGILMESIGSLFITESTIAGNIADNFGGGIENVGGTLIITKSTLSGNTAGFQGGGIYNNGGPITITNSTLSGNTSPKGGGLYIASGNSTITNNTIAENSATTDGGGLYINNDTYTLTISNNIIAKSPLGGNCYERTTGTINGMFSLADDNTCGGFNNNPNINFFPLDYYGGSTRTYALMFDNPAIDAANAAVCSATPISGVDQRGAARSIDGNGTPNNPATGDCDIGAYENNPQSGYIPNLQFATSSSTYTPGGANLFTIPIALDSPSKTGYASIKAYIWVSGGTAIPDIDYPFFGVQTVTFNPGDQMQSITLDLTNLALTGERTLILSFAISSGPGFSGPTHLGPRTSHTVTLKPSTASAAPVHYYYGTRNIILTWAPISWATGYEIQVDNEPTFAAPRIGDYTGIPAGTLSLNVIVAGDGTYYWRVRGQGIGSPAFSAPQSFVVVAGT